MELEEVKTVNDCMEAATIDAHDLEEQVSGWLACFEDVFSDVSDVEVLGEIVKLEKFDIEKNTVLVALCRRNKKQAKVTIGSIKLLEGTKVQKLWLKAWDKWQ